MKTAHSFKISFLYFLFFGSLLICSDSFAQKSNEGIKIKGSVVDQDGKIVKGAAILIKGTTSGTASDLDGNFALTVPSTSSILVVSFIDFETKEVLVGDNTEFEISLKSEAKFLLAEEGFMVHDRVDELPKPSEGIEGWNRYMARNIKYPQSSRESNTQGTVIVGFEVKEDGTVANVEVIRGIGGECDEEAVRIIAEGPQWIPGKKGDQAVTTQISLPIRFVLAVEPGIASPKQQNEKAIADRFGKHVIVVGYQAK
jgi:TonB family protein